MIVALALLVALLVLIALVIWRAQGHVMVVLDVERLVVRRGSLLGGDTDVLAWSSLGEVAVVRRAGMDSGVPFELELVRLDDEPLRVPAGAVNFPALVDGLRALPGFDERAFVEGVREGSRHRTVCWTRSAPPDFVN